MVGRRMRSPAWRAIAVLAVAMLAAGALSGGSAVAGKFLTKKKALKLFYTKPASDARFVNVGEPVTQAQNADQLDGKSANELVRGARVMTETSATFTSATTNYGPALSITAPAAGFVLVSASVSVRNGGGSCTTSCIWWQNVRHVQSGTMSNSAVGSVYPSGTADVFDSNSSSWMFPVNAGVNTFQIVLTRNNLGNGNLEGWFAEMTGLYVPFGSTGGATPRMKAPS